MNHLANDTNTCYICNRTKAEVDEHVRKQLDKTEYYDSKVSKHRNKMAGLVEQFNTRCNNLLEATKATSILNFKLKTLYTDIPAFEKSIPLLRELLQFVGYPERSGGKYKYKDDMTLHDVRNYIITIQQSLEGKLKDEDNSIDNLAYVEIREEQEVLANVFQEKEQYAKEVHEHVRRLHFDTITIPLKFAEEVGDSIDANTPDLARQHMVWKGEAKVVIHKQNLEILVCGICKRYLEKPLWRHMMKFTRVMGVGTTTTRIILGHKSFVWPSYFIY